MNKLLVIFLSIFTLSKVYGQISIPEITYSVDYPNDISNNRFFMDAYADKITRPSLSITGFNSSDLKTGYGLEQLVYYLAYNKEYNTNPEMSVLINKIEEDAITEFISITGTDKQKVDAVNTNARYLESKAFMALLGYVLQKNGYNYSDLDSALTDKSYTVYLNGFKQQLLTPEGGYLISFELHNGSVLSSPADPIHTTASFGSVIRAFDLYLGLENAFPSFRRSTFGMQSRSSSFKKICKEFHSRRSYQKKRPWEEADSNFTRLIIHILSPARCLMG
tara:strand:+ start:78124 stop:78957 length:834 start_codon:yes stop_codon:yes gene_type:complete